MADLLSIILAAGEGKRMHSSLPKVLHRVGGLPIVSHVVNAAIDAGSTRVAVVTGPGHGSVREVVSAISPTVEFFEQTERRGTAHAAKMARSLWHAAEGSVAVVYGDHPLLRARNFAAVLQRLDLGMDAAVLGFEPADPTGYGRLITDGDRLLAIREHRDASEEERRIGLCNACILVFRAPVFRELIDKVGNANSQGEYYVTDLVGLANGAGYKVGYGVAPEADVMGVNDRAQLARAEKQFQELRREDFLAAGVTMHDPATVYVSWDTEIGKDVVLEPNVVLGPGVHIGEGAKVFAFSHIENSTLGPGVTVGPFARLRGGTVLADDVHIGNFVELKNAHLGQGVKAGHLSYLGDTEIGARSNIGAGTITCNYDGVNKSVTTIGQGAFIGSNSALVAPVSIGDRAYVASGSVITRNVEADALAVGRARQENKPGYAPRLKARAEAVKAAKARR